MKFPYLKQPTADPSAPWISRPVIPVRLFYRGTPFDVYALLDSGADVTLFHSSVARALGIDLATGRQVAFRGIAGDAVAGYFHTIQLQLIGSPEVIELEAGFTDAPGVRAILGQTGFFEHYRITFDRSKELIEIRPKKA